VKEAIPPTSLKKGGGSEKGNIRHSDEATKEVEKNALGHTWSTSNEFRGSLIAQEGGGGCPLCLVSGKERTNKAGKDRGAAHLERTSESRRRSIEKKNGGN